MLGVIKEDARSLDPKPSIIKVFQGDTSSLHYSSRSPMHCLAQAASESSCLKV